MGEAKKKAWGARLNSASVLSLCCDDMARAVTFDCEHCRDSFDCADVLVHYSEAHGHFGLIIRDGGKSWVKIDFCPWCGQQL
jgi:hypothetical protein